MDDALLEKQREAYAVKGVDESEPAQPLKKKRKQVYVNGEEVRQIFKFMSLISGLADNTWGILRKLVVEPSAPRKPNPHQNPASARTQLSTQQTFPQMRPLKK